MPGLARFLALLRRQARGQNSISVLPIQNKLDLKKKKKTRRRSKRHTNLTMRIDSSSSSLRLQAVEFLIQSATQLEVTPIVKYTALTLFADRFYSSLSRFIQRDDKRSWLLQPIRESSLQLFGLISLWISSKIHDSRLLSVKSLKSLGDKFIQEDHFTTRDFLEAYEWVFYFASLLLKVLDFEIGTTNTAFGFIEALFIQFRGVAKAAELMNFDACMDIMDLLYETEETSVLYSSPCSLAASVLAFFNILQVSAYVTTVPQQRWEFPIIPW
ncbi:Cyclin_N domain-containing protein, partial [Cephalotus follicularis]